MRIFLSTTPSEEKVEYNYQPKLVGTLHKWLGKNESHGNLSLYSFSWLNCGQSEKGGIRFPKGATWFISSHDNELLKGIMDGIQKEPDLFAGMKVKDVMIKEDPEFPEKVTFWAASPVFVKRKEEGGGQKHYTFEDEGVDALLTETMKTKLQDAGISTDGIRLAFDRDYGQAKTKLVSYNGIKNRASLCPIVAEGSKKQLQFVWNVGAGNSTGIGFGALK